MGRILQTCYSYESGIAGRDMASLGLTMLVIVGGRPTNGSNRDLRRYFGIHRYCTVSPDRPVYLSSSRTCHGLFFCLNMLFLVLGGAVSSGVKPRSPILASLVYCIT